MSKVTKPEAPKRPLSTYFMFRQDVWNTIKGDKKNAQLKDLWDNMDAKKKQQYETEYQGAMDKWKK